MGIVGCRNIGKLIEIRLAEVGVNSLEDLKRIGSENAYQRLYNNNKNISRSILFSLEGAIKDVRWFDLSDSRKDELESFYKSLKERNDEHFVKYTRKRAKLK